MVKKIVMLLLTTLVANAYAGTVSDSLRTTLYYRSGYSLLELSYMDNAAKLQNLNGGKAWKYMLANHFDSLRYGALVVCEIRHIVPSVSPTDSLSLIQNQQGSEQDSLPQKDAQETASQLQVYSGENAAEAENAAHASGRNSYYALKTNLLYDALLVPNLSLEASIGSGWTLGAGGMFAWWSKDAKHRYWRIYGGDLEIRKYFGALSKSKPLQGHHLGIYGDFLTYDFEFGAKGYQSKATYAAGIRYGYSHPIGKRLNLDFALGIGYLHSNYKTYVPRDGCYVYQETKKQKWLGPTQAEISLVWLLGKGNTNTKGNGNGKGNTQTKKGGKK